MDYNLPIFKSVECGIEKVDYDRIINRLPEYFRGSAIIGHSTSQASYSLQTMNMISDSPMSRMKQCLAQIDRRYQGLREAHFKVEKMKLDIIELNKKADDFSHLDVLEKTALIQEMVKNMNIAFREIGLFQDMYDSIMKNNNIPINWSEKDFEKQEMENMIRASFRLAIQDLSQTGRCSKAVVEYWEQLGIHPQVGEIETRKYMVWTQEQINQNIKITIKDMYYFLDEMVTLHQDDYKYVINRIGLDTLGSERYMSESVRDINK